MVFHDYRSVGGALGYVVSLGSQLILEGSGQERAMKGDICCDLSRPQDRSSVMNGLLPYGQ
jgi:hypothetical protein